MTRFPRPVAAAAILLLTTIGLGSCGDGQEDLQVQDVTEEVREELAEVGGDIVGESSTHRRTITIAGRDREYLVSTPPNVDDSSNLALLMVFHGYKSSADTMRKLTNFDDANAVVVYMEGFNSAWAPAPYAATSGEEDLEFFDQVRAQIIDEYPVNPARVFAIGHSNGGGFAAYAACHRAHQLTGIATVSAAYYKKVLEGCSEIPTKQIDMHGTSDGTIKYEGGWRYDTEYEPVDRVMTEAATRNHCAPSPTADAISRPGEEFTWQACDAPLRHYRLDGGGHSWPGSTTDRSGASDDFASKEILDYFGISARGTLNAK